MEKATKLVTVLPDGTVVSNPVQAVPGAETNIALVFHTQELYMGDLGIQLLQGFEKFENLKILWINNNKLTSITGLDSNFRIRVLNAHYNKINTLRGSLDYLYNIEELNVAHNEISHLDVTLSFLKDFRYLRSLWLHNNPVAQEVNYRQRVILTLPDLKLLDNKPVTDEERSAAAKDVKRSQQQPRVGTSPRRPATTARSKSVERSVAHRWALREASATTAKEASLAVSKLKEAFTAHVDAEWKAALQPTSVGAPPASALMSVISTEAAVADITSRQVLQSLQNRTASTGRAVVAPEVSLRGSTLVGAAEIRDVSEDVAGVWDKYRIRAIFNSISTDGSGQLDRQQLANALEMLGDLALAAVLPVGISTLAEYANTVVDLMASSDTVKVNANDFVAAIESGRCVKTITTTSRRTSVHDTPSKPSSSKAPARPAKAVAESAPADTKTNHVVVEVPKLGWKALTAKEAIARANRHAEFARSSLFAASKMSDGDAKAKQLRAQAGFASEKAIYLENYAAALQGAFDPEPIPSPPLQKRVDYYSYTRLTSGSGSHKEDESKIERALEDVVDPDVASALRRSLHSPSWQKLRRTEEARAPKTITLSTLRL